MNKELPDLHKKAFMYKNRKKLQHDGGRAWIKDSQLHEARSGVNGHLETVKQSDVKNTESRESSVSSAK